MQRFTHKGLLNEVHKKNWEPVHKYILSDNNLVAVVIKNVVFN